MISVKVTYTVNADFVAENKQNIATFLSDFGQINNGEFLYEVFLLADGVTFMHISQYRDEAVQQDVLAVPSFVEFQRKRDDSGLSGSHHIEVMEFIGSAV
jgi:hypothetical protein